jgi:hypothetical protein
MERYECSEMMIWPADYRSQLLGAPEIIMLPIRLALKARLLVALACDLSLVFEATEFVSELRAHDV